MMKVIVIKYLFFNVFKIFISTNLAIKNCDLITLNEIYQ